MSPISNLGTVAFRVDFSTTSISRFCIETSFLRAERLTAAPHLTLVQDQEFQSESRPVASELTAIL